MDYMSSEDVYELIGEQKFGYLILSDAITGHQLCFYPSTDDLDDLNIEKKASSVPAAELRTKLQTILKRLGAGKYRIKLRKNAKATQTEVTYHFQYLMDGANTPASPQISGLGYASPEDVKRQIDEGIAGFKASFLKEQEIADLKKQIEELKKPKPKVKKEKSGMDAESIKILAGTFASTVALPIIFKITPEIYSDVVGAVNKFAEFDLNVEPEEDDDTIDQEHEEVKEPFKKPE